MAQFVGRSGADELQQAFGLLQTGIGALRDRTEAMRKEDIANWEENAKVKLGMTVSKSWKELAAKDPAFAQKYFQKTKGMSPEDAKIFAEGLANTSENEEYIDSMLGYGMKKYGMPGEEQTGGQTGGQTEPAGKGVVPVQNVVLQKTPAAQPEYPTGPQGSPEQGTGQPARAAATMPLPSDAPAVSVGSGEAGAKKKTDVEGYTNPELVYSYSSFVNTGAAELRRKNKGKPITDEETMNVVRSAWSGMKPEERSLLVKKYGSEADAISKMRTIVQSNADIWANARVAAPVEERGVVGTREEAAPEAPAPLQFGVPEKPTALVQGETAQQEFQPDLPVGYAVKGGAGASPRLAGREVSEDTPLTPGQKARLVRQASMSSGVSTQKAVSGFEAGSSTRVSDAAVKAASGQDSAKNVRLGRKYLAEENAASVEALNGAMTTETWKQFLRTQNAMRSDPAWQEARAAAGDEDAMKILAARGESEQRALERKRIDAQSAQIDAQLEQGRLDAAQNARLAKIQEVQIALSAAELEWKKADAGPERELKQALADYERQNLLTEKEIMLLRLQSAQRDAAVKTGDETLKQYAQLAEPFEKKVFDTEQTINDILVNQLNPKDKNGNPVPVTDSAKLRGIVSSLNLLADQYDAAASKLCALSGDPTYMTPHARYTVDIVKKNLIGEWGKISTTSGGSTPAASSTSATSDAAKKVGDKYGIE